MKQSKAATQNHDSPAWSREAKKMFLYLKESWQQRPVTEYRLGDLECYVPNSSCLMPSSLASDLAKLGRERASAMPSESAGATAWNFFRKFAWSSSLLDGIEFSMEDANAVFNKIDYDWQYDVGTLKQNLHAIRYAWLDATYSPLYSSFIRQAHTYAMVGLLPSRHLGAVRNIMTRVDNSTYRPLNDVAKLDELLDLMCTKAAAITNPIEASFFLWLHTTYLQAFTEGNKRTSRVAANFPLFKAKYVPLTFAGIAIGDYQAALTSFYEVGDVSIAVDLFEWSYRKAKEEYAGLDFWERNPSISQSTG